MSTKNKLIGITLSAAVGLAFMTVKAEDIPNSPNRIVKCYGINSCRGKSSCMLTTHECKILNQCKGKNSCKGQGFIYKTAANCAKLGGTSPQTPQALDGLEKGDGSSN
jgi:hypothetical protein